MPLRILVAGDLHLGRASSRVPEGIDAGSLSAASAWDAIVEAAIAERVDLLVLTGDITDRENRFWEAIGPLRRGVGRLASAGIDTVAVAGNHDFETLPRLAESLAGDTATAARFRLLGAGGRWERRMLRRDGRDLLALDGWSFPNERVVEDPLASHGAGARGGAGAAATGVPVLGVVHGDLDVPDSIYAPIGRARLRASPCAAWLLGHVHAPALVDLGGAWALYPGSPQALDFGEPGAHGAWLVEIEGGRVGRPRLVPLSSVRYESRGVDLAGADDEGAVRGRVMEAIRAAEREAVDAGGRRLRGLSLRLMLHGRTAALDAVRRLVREPFTEYAGGTLDVLLDRIESSAEPALDLSSLARGESAIAVAARRLLALERDDPDAATAAILSEAQRRAAAVHERSDFLGLAQVRGDEAPDAEAVRGLVAATLRDLVDALARQEGR